MLQNGQWQNVCSCSCVYKNLCCICNSPSVTRGQSHPPTVSQTELNEGKRRRTAVKVSEMTMMISQVPLEDFSSFSYQGACSGTYSWLQGI